jgi:hypothetical protein
MLIRSLRFPLSFPSFFLAKHHQAVPGFLAGASYYRRQNLDATVSSKGSSPSPCISSSRLARAPLWHPRLVCYSQQTTPAITPGGHRRPQVLQRPLRLISGCHRGTRAPHHLPRITPHPVGHLNITRSRQSITTVSHRSAAPPPAPFLTTSPKP